MFIGAFLCENYQVGFPVCNVRREEEAALTHISSSTSRAGRRIHCAVANLELSTWQKYGCTLASETQSSRIILILYTINYRSYPVPFNMIQHVYTVVVSQKMWHKMCLTFLSQSLLLLLARVGFPQNNLLGRTKRVSLETKNLVKNEQIRRKNVLFVACFLMNCL